MGRYAIITGGSSGIGRHLVSAFVDAGFSVLVVLAVSSSSVRAWVRE